MWIRESSSIETLWETQVEKARVIYLNIVVKESIKIPFDFKFDSKITNKEIVINSGNLHPVQIQFILILFDIQRKWFYMVLSYRQLY